MKIGVLSRNYAARRLFFNKFSEYVYKDIRFYNIFLWKNIHLLFLLKLKSPIVSPEKLVSKIFYNFKSIISTKCDLFHFFNCINWNKNKWVVNVETAIPWTENVIRIVESDIPDFHKLHSDKEVKKCIERLANKNCIALLPISLCSYNIQEELLKVFPTYYKTIMKKTILLHPPQNLIVKKIEDKGLTWDDEELFTFIYVARNFFRKGGWESLNTLIDLRKKYKFKFILISSLEEDEKKYTQMEYNEIVEKINNNRSWIEYYKYLPNNEVINMLKKAHVCLLPTWMDTYAYSVIESQACGTPVITTNIRALSEINKEDIGWLIDVPVNRLNHPLHNTSEQIERFHNILQHGLYEKIEWVLTHRNEVKEKSILCIDKIKKCHNPHEYNKTLERIYLGNR